MNNNNDNIKNQETDWYTYTGIETEKEQKNKDAIQLVSMVAIILTVILMVLLQIS